MSGVEWLVDAHGCSEDALRDPQALARLFEAIVTEMRLKPIGDAVWHQFPDTGGITGVWLLRESHLAIHTFPEFTAACLNLFCCSSRPAMDWRRRLHASLGATDVAIQEHQRHFDFSPRALRLCGGSNPDANE